MNHLKAVEPLLPVLPGPPPGLTPKSRRWWKKIAERYELEAHHIELLSQAAAALDRIESARQALKKDGQYYTDVRGVRRSHPALVIANQASMLFAKLLRQLDLDTEPPPENHRRMPQLGRRGR